MSNLGWCYDRREGVARDASAALAWYRKAAALGEAQAMHSLGGATGLDGVWRRTMSWPFLGIARRRNWASVTQCSP